MTTETKSLSDRIHQWDDWVEDEDEDQEEARRPFDAGIMLAVAKVLERWESAIWPRPCAT